MGNVGIVTLILLSGSAMQLVPKGKEELWGPKDPTEPKTPKNEKSNKKVTLGVDPKVTKK